MRYAYFVLFAAAHAGCASQSAPVGGIPPVSGEERTLGGVRYVDVKVGGGVEAAQGSCVYAHYTGWLESGSRFDTSREPAPGEPVSFRLGTGRVIRGWDIGFAGMRVGGRRRLTIPYQLAYGEGGSPPVIPARANLVFDVEVHAVVDPAGGSRPCPAWSTVVSR